MDAALLNYGPNLWNTGAILLKIAILCFASSHILSKG